MHTKQLGASDLFITPIGFGAWAIGGSGWEFGWGAQDDRESIAAIREGLDAGINWIDTAAVYGLGHSEEVVARGLDALAHARKRFRRSPPGLAVHDARDGGDGDAGLHGDFAQRNRADALAPARGVGGHRCGRQACRVWTPQRMWGWREGRSCGWRGGSPASGKRSIDGSYFWKTRGGGGWPTGGAIGTRQDNI